MMLLRETKFNRRALARLKILGCNKNKKEGE
jgi:hypothetical protein